LRFEVCRRLGKGCICAAKQEEGQEFFHVSRKL
jgi:hypothetical protein